MATTAIIVTYHDYRISSWLHGLQLGQSFIHSEHLVDKCFRYLRALLVYKMEVIENFLVFTELTHCSHGVYQREKSSWEVYLHIES